MWQWLLIGQKKNGLDQEAIVDIGIYGVIGGFLGAKILYVIVEFKTFIKDPKTVLGSEGFVVYGGIIAGFLTAIVYCRIKKLYFLEYFDLAVASISMAQGFGRIGCFLAGCVAMEGRQPPDLVWSSRKVGLLRQV